MAEYIITNVGAARCLNIYGSNVTSLTNNQNVTLWQDSGTTEQVWEISSLGSNVKVKSVIDKTFGLNAYRSGTNWNCDVLPISGNDTDSAVTFEKSGDCYKIKLTNYTNRYLTAGGTGNGANVYWAAATNAENQLWDIEKRAIPASKTLTMPVNVSQSYSGNPDWIIDYGCGVCCQANLASYYDKSRNYTIQDIIDCGAAAENAGSYLGRTPKTSFKDFPGSNYINKIARQINLGRPVLLHCKNTAGNEHWVVAFKYVNSCKTLSDIYVLDSAAGSSTSQVGAIRTLTASMAHNHNLTYVNNVKITREKK